MIAARAAVQALHYAAAMQIFGASAFLWALVPPKLAGTIGGAAGRLTALSIIVAALSACGWLVLEAADLGGAWGKGLDPETLKAVLFDTAFGRVWQIQLGVAAGLSLLLLLPKMPWRLAVGLSAVLLAGLGFVGHAMLQSGPVGWLHHANHMLHLFAAGSWVGSLIPLLFVMRHLDDPGLRQEAGVALRRFSSAGHGVVALVLATGVINTVLVLGRWPVDWHSAYQAVLAIKIALVAAMVGLALVNRYGIVPRMVRDPDRGLAQLRGNTNMATALGAAVLAAAGLLGLLEPD